MTDIELTVPENTEAERLDSYIARTVETLTRAAVQRLMESGMITVNGMPPKPSLKLKGGEQLKIAVPPPVEAGPAPENIPLEILYEDRDLVVVNKDAGMVVHPGAGNSGGTLVNAFSVTVRTFRASGGSCAPA